jgi:hypothetical protein
MCFANKRKSQERRGIKNRGSKTLCFPSFMDFASFAMRGWAGLNAFLVDAFEEYLILHGFGFHIL